MDSLGEARQKQTTLEQFGRRLLPATVLNIRGNQPGRRLWRRTRRYTYYFLGETCYISCLSPPPTHPPPVPSLFFPRSLSRVVAGEGFLGGGAGVGSGGGAAAARGSGEGGDWVDEGALRAAMSRAYETFALMNGTVSDALRAPTALLPTGCASGGSGGGGERGDGGGTVSGFEVLRRLASARKRLRKAKREAQEVRLPKGVA